MRPGGSSEKGASFERGVCKKLSLWISEGESTGLFWRSAMSGGRATITLKKDEKLQSQAGDVSAIDEQGHKFISTFFVECKHYSNLNIESAVLKRTGNLINFWKKLQVDAEKYEKRPFLVAKQNFVRPLLGLKISTIYRPPDSGPNCLFKLPDIDLIIYDFEEILDHKPFI